MRVRGLFNEAATHTYKILRGVEKRDEAKLQPDALCSSKVGRAEPVAYERQPVRGQLAPRTPYTASPSRAV